MVQRSENIRHLPFPREIDASPDRPLAGMLLEMCKELDRYNTEMANHPEGREQYTMGFRRYVGQKCHELAPVLQQIKLGHREATDSFLRGNVAILSQLFDDIRVIPIVEEGLRYIIHPDTLTFGYFLPPDEESEPSTITVGEASAYA